MCSFAHGHMRTHMHTHIYAHTRTRRKRTNTYRVDTALTQAHTHTYTIQTHTQTHTHTHMYVQGAHSSHASRVRPVQPSPHFHDCCYWNGDLQHFLKPPPLPALPLYHSCHSFGGPEAHPCRLGVSGRVNLSSYDRIIGIGVSGCVHFSGPDKKERSSVCLAV